MRKDFFARFEVHEKTLHKTVSLTESEWRLLDAYRLFGSSHAGHEIPLQKLLREITLAHIQGNRDFMREQTQWLAKLAELETLAEGDSQ